MSALVLSAEVERFYAHITGVKEGLTRRAAVDERIPLECLMWTARAGHLYEVLVHADPSVSWYPIARVWVEHALGDLVQVARWEWHGPAITRVAGEARCEMCGRSYREHPYADEPQHLYEGRPYLHRDCDGRLLKL